MELTEPNLCFAVFKLRSRKERDDSIGTAIELVASTAAANVTRNRTQRLMIASRKVKSWTQVEDDVSLCRSFLLLAALLT